MNPAGGQERHVINAWELAAQELEEAEQGQQTRPRRRPYSNTPSITLVSRPAASNSSGGNVSGGPQQPPLATAIPCTFDPFLRLPPEIRIMIWKLTTPGHRYFTVWTGYVRAPSEGFQGRTRMLVRSQFAYPEVITLRINRESRETARKMYEETLLKHSRGKYLNWNFELDGLYFNNYEALRSFKEFHGAMTDREIALQDMNSFIAKVQNVIIAGDLCTGARLAAFVAEFSSLKSLIIQRPDIVDVMDQRYTWEGENSLFLWHQWQNLERTEPPFVEYKSVREIFAMVPPRRPSAFNAEAEAERHRYRR